MDPVIRLIFKAILLICLVKLRVLVIVRPRYLNSMIHSISFPPNNITGKWEAGREENIINLLFDALGTNLFMLRYAERSEKRFRILFSSPSRVGDVKTKAASSANSTVSSSTARGRSLIYKLKHNGPKIDPCGTPVSIGIVADL